MILTQLKKEHINNRDYIYKKRFQYVQEFSISSGDIITNEREKYFSINCLKSLLEKNGVPNKINKIFQGIMLEKWTILEKISHFMKFMNFT